ncbi:hypothetical protein B6P85_23835 [Escherichia coli]|nr:hypothetical protein [Escherichia coli]EFO2610978.1 hypothetical protein [Escherichia coli]EFO2714123.1 hypothetical protein [Escherichia coli]
MVFCLHVLWIRFPSGFVVFKNYLCRCCVFYPACRFIFSSWGIHSVLIRSHWRCSMAGCRKVLPR